MSDWALFSLLALLVTAGLVRVARRVRAQGTGFPRDITHDRRAMTAGALAAMYPLSFGFVQWNVLGALPAAVLFGISASLLVHRRGLRRERPQ